MSAATPATSGPPNSPAMLSTTERASKITPGTSTSGVSMPTAQTPPKMSPETNCPASGR